MRRERHYRRPRRDANEMAELLNLDLPGKNGGTFC